MDIGSKLKEDGGGDDDAASGFLKHDLEWKEFFGSSLSLYAGLSSIYEKISRGVDTVPYIADDSFTKSGINRLFIVENIDESDSVELKTCQIDCFDDDERGFVRSRSAVSTERGETTSLPKQMILETDSLDITRSAMDVRKGSDDGADSAAGYCLSLPSSSSVFPDADDRKRPLSVTSTSSSSSSSLPRHIRKRIANMSSSLAVGPSTADAAASCEMLSTVAECCSSPGDAHCSKARGGFFYGDLDEGSKSTRQDDEIPVSSSSRQCNSSSVVDEYLAASDVDELTESSERNGYDCFEGSKLLTGVAYVERVVVEILETERNYVKDLSDLVQGYVYSIRNDTELEFSGSDIDALFGNIETIWEFNRYFLSRLEECDCDPIKIADCFVSEIRGFEIYSTFCTNYPRSMETLMKMMKDEKVAEFLRKQQTLLQHALPLGSYLLKPVQRILKYHILLQNIFNNHDMSEEGHGIIEKALDSMMSVAAHINEMKRQHERALRFQEIQCHLCDWDGTDLMTLGNLILEERFRVCGAKGLRHLFLFEKAVMLTKERENGMLIVKSFIMFSNLMFIESVPKEPLSFQLIPYYAPREQVTLQASSIEQKRFWCQWIKKLMLDNYGPKIPDKAKELVMMLGKSREEENFESSNNEIPELVKKQHNAPAYLEKRRGRRKSAGFIHDLKLKPRKAMKSGLSTSDASQLKPDGSKCDARSSDMLQATDDEESFSVSCGDDDDKVGSESGSRGNCSCVQETSASEFYKRDCNFSSESSCSPATSPNGKTREKIGFDASFPGHSPVVGRKVGDVQSVNDGKCGGGISENHCRKQSQKIVSSHSTASLAKVPECIAGPYGGSFYRSNSAGGELHRDIDDWIDDSANDDDKVSQGETIESGEYQLKWYRSLRKPASNSTNMLCRKSVSGSVGSRLLEESSIDGGSKAIAKGRCKTSTRTITASSSCTKLPSEEYVDPGQVVNYSQTLQGRHHQHASKTSGRSPKTNLDQKFSKSLKSNLAKKMIASGRCEFEFDSENEDDHLNSVHSALARLTSRIPAESLQSSSSYTAPDAYASNSATSPSEILLKGDDRKDTRNKLARLLGRSPNGKNKFPSEGSSPTSPSLAEYLKDRHLTIGERMAISPDQAFDSLFTIANRNTHRRTPLSECKQMFDRLQTESKDANAGAPEPACENNSSTRQYEVKVLQVKQEEKDDALTDGCAVNNIEGDSDSEFYYENKLLEDLEDGFKNDDDEEDGQSSDVRSDDDVGGSQASSSLSKKSTAPPPPPRMTIKETLHSIERRSNARPVRRVEVQLGEKAQGMREIMQALENVGKNGHEGSASFYGKIVHRTVRDRTRELAVCAAITRLRQNNCDAVTIESLAVDKDCLLSHVNDKCANEIAMAESLQPETRTSRL